MSLTKKDSMKPSHPNPFLRTTAFQMIHRYCPRLLALLCILTLNGVSSFADQNDRELNRMVRRGEKLAASIKDVQSLENSQIPHDVMREAKGIIVLKQYEAGVIFGAMGGFGIVAKRNSDGRWSAPAWLKTGQISGGLQLGAQKLNVVLVIMKDDGLKMLEKAKFQLGVDATVFRGPTGTNRDSKMGVHADILAYTVYEGYYAGATFEGGYLLPDNKLNEYAYGERMKVSEIVNSEDLSSPAALDELFTLLRKIEQDKNLFDRPR